jgi:xylan 1,4-beta-xylosidase
LLTSVPCPDNPLQKTGHASFLHKGDEWYITHICARPLTRRGRCTLGRETAIQKIEWIDGWPRLTDGGNAPSLDIDGPAGNTVFQKAGNSRQTDFNEPELPAWFQTLRGPLGNAATLTQRPGWFRLYGRESLTSLHRQALIATRWQSTQFRVETVMEFSPKTFQQTAGLVCIYNTENWMYAYLTAGGHGPELNVLICDNRKLSLTPNGVAVPEKTPLGLAVEVDRAALQFYFSVDNKMWRSLGEILPADHLSDDYIEKNGLVFTGSFVGICCQDMNDRTAFADFDSFSYIEH